MDNWNGCSYFNRFVWRAQVQSWEMGSGSEGKFLDIFCLSYFCLRNTLVVVKRVGVLPRLEWAGWPTLWVGVLSINEKETHLKGGPPVPRQPVGALSTSAKRMGPSCYSKLELISSGNRCSISFIHRKVRVHA